MNYILFLLIILVTNVIQAITGFAGTLLSMPPSILLIGVTDAKVIINFVTLISCLSIVLINRKAVQWKKLAKILVFMTIGMIAGIQIFKMVQFEFLLYGYGILILIIAFTKLFGKESQRTLPEWLMIVTLLAAGVIHGMFLSGGALLVVYAVCVLKDKAEFRATIASVWVVLNTFMVINDFISGTFTQQNATYCIVGCIPAFIGVFIGNKMHSRISQSLFMKITYILLIISGLLCFL